MDSRTFWLPQAVPRNYAGTTAHGLARADVPQPGSKT